MKKERNKMNQKILLYVIMLSFKMYSKSFQSTADKVKNVEPILICFFIIQKLSHLVYILV